MPPRKNRSMDPRDKQVEYKLDDDGKMIIKPCCRFKQIIVKFEGENQRIYADIINSNEIRIFSGPNNPKAQSEDEEETDKLS